MFRETTVHGNRLVAAAIGLAVLASPALAQHEHHGGKAAEEDSGAVAQTDAAMSGPMTGFAARHMEMTPPRTVNAADSARAAGIVRELRIAIARYRDVDQAVKDGYRMFAPKLKTQRIFHFTHYGAAVKNSFGFDPARPTSLLYAKDEAGDMTLVGAMYTAPKRASLDDLDRRIPLSVARWHRHVNFCVPKVRERERWRETKDGAPVFGPLSPIATERECAAVGGRFVKQVFGWMVHANVFASDDPKMIWEHEHGGPAGEHHDH